MQDPSDSLERAALEDVHRALSEHLVEPLRWRSTTIDGAFCGVSGGLPASAIVLNRTIGLAGDDARAETALGRIVAAYRRAGVSRYFVHGGPDPAGRLARALGDAGLVRRRGWQKFERGTEAAAGPSTDLQVREVGAEHASAFARIVCDAFDLGDAALPWIAALPGRARWSVFMSFDGERPAGAGALFVDGALAWYDFAATAPAFRRRGSQAAVLARLIDHARALGCRRLFTCTGEAVPGDPQHSFNNIVRAGFRATGVRPNYAPAGS